MPLLCYGQFTVFLKNGQKLEFTNYIARDSMSIVGKTLSGDYLRVYSKDVNYYGHVPSIAIKPYSAGRELQKASQKTLIGAGLAFSGVILNSIGALSALGDKPVPELYIVGSVLSMVGGVVSFTAAFNIGRAGKLLDAKDYQP
jgi:hypothetical protein